MEFCSTRERLSLTDRGQLEGYASVFGSVVNTWMPTVFEPGSWTKTLKEDFSRVRILWGHDTADAIGIPLEMKEDRKGLYVKGQLSNTAKIADYRQLIKDGVVDALSVGFDPVLYEFQEGANVPGGVLRRIKEASLWEWSICVWGADPQASISNISSHQGRLPAPTPVRGSADALVAGYARRTPQPPAMDAAARIPPREYYVNDRQYAERLERRIVGIVSVWESEGYYRRAQQFHRSARRT